METSVIPVILAGGTGSRLWPVSRESYPKQFCNLFDEMSLLQNTAVRAKHITHSGDIIVITSDNYYFLCKDQLENIGIKRIHYILEPCSKNTAPAIALAAQYARKHIDPDASLLVLPSDHYLPDPVAFEAVIQKASYFLEHNKCVTFGVRPTSAKTGYGYIESGEPLESEGFEVKRFIEKPSLALAQTYLAQGGFYWNSGIFLFKAKTYLDELSLLSNDIYVQSLVAFDASQKQDDFMRIDGSFSECRSASIDYEVMEKTKNAVVFGLSLEWSDLGCWAALSEIEEADINGNVIQGNVLARDTTNCLISSENRRVVTIGLKDQLIISTGDAVLVANKAYAQDVKKAVEQMKLQEDPVATQHKRIYRPWGFFDQISSGPGYQVKHLMIKPGGAISLQLHYRRSEHWVVVSGEAEVTINDEVTHLVANQSAYVEKEATHRLRNLGSVPLSIIEVQSGDYLEEDDIVRFEDAYARVKK